MLLLLPVFASQIAAETITLTIEEAIGRALDHNINLRKSAIDLAQAEFSARNLWSEVIPSFNLSPRLEILPATPLFTDPGFAFNDLRYNLGLSVNLSLNTNLGFSMKRIELAYRTQQITYEIAAKQAEIQVVKKFFEMITRQENIAYLEETFRLATQKMENDRIAWQNGLLSELAWLNSRLSVETARYNLFDARGNYEIQLGDFLTSLGMEPGTDIIFSGSFEIAPMDLNPEQLILEHLPRRPDIIRQRQIIERAELTNFSSRLPTLSLSAGWGLGSQLQNFDAPLRDSLSASITLNIPIDSYIPGTRQNQAIRANSADVEKARLDLQSMQTAAETRIRSLVLNIRNTWESLEIARLRLELAQRTLEVAEAGYRNGLIGFQELEDRRNDLNDYRYRLMNSELIYKNYLLDLAVELNVDWRPMVIIR